MKTLAKYFCPAFGP